MQHLLSISEVAADEIHRLLDMAQGFFAISRRRIKKVPSLRGRTIINAFFEPSTRTRVSFELAGKRLSADTINISASGSAVAKGESLRDTAETLDAMQPDAIVLRHGASGSSAFMARHCNAAVVNAGDGWHQHPSQALLDLKTIRDHFGRLDGLEVAIIGDVQHSRVARSDMEALRVVGAKVRVAGPRTLLPMGLAATYGVEVCATVEEAIDGAHVVMALRLQQERMHAGLLPDLREYAIFYGINPRRFSRAREDAILMHPGPVNRGVELSDELLASEKTVILTQVENGVAVRCAVLFTLLGGEA